MSLKEMEETAGDHETPLLESGSASGVQALESPFKRTGWFKLISFLLLHDIIQFALEKIELPEFVYLL